VGHGQQAAMDWDHLHLGFARNVVLNRLVSSRAGWPVRSRGACQG
jgi:hypothetical protein